MSGEMNISENEIKPWAKSQRAAYEALQGKRCGMTIAALAQATGLCVETMKHPLMGLQRLGLAVWVGQKGSHHCRWCLTEHQKTALGAFKAAQTNSERAARKKRSRIDKHMRALNRVQQVTVKAHQARPLPIPAVNSVWSLGA